MSWVVEISDGAKVMFGAPWGHEGEYHPRVTPYVFDFYDRANDCTDALRAEGIVAIVRPVLEKGKP